MEEWSSGVPLSRVGRQGGGSARSAVGGSVRLGSTSDRSRTVDAPVAAEQPTVPLVLPRGRGAGEGAAEGRYGLRARVVWGVWR